MGRTKTNGTKTDSSAHLGFEAKLWLSADTATRVSASRDCAATWRVLRGAQDHRSNTMHAAEYKHLVQAKCEVRSAKSERRLPSPFDIRNSAFDILTGPEHADTFRRDLSIAFPISQPLF